MSTHTVSPTQKAFNIWGIILALWACYRATIGKHSPITIDEFVLKPLLFFYPVIMYVRAYEHKSLEHGLWLKFKKWKQDMGYGALIAAPLVVYFGFIMVTRTKPIQDPLLYILLSIVLATTEETLSRGFVATRVYEETGSFFKTLLQSSILHLFLRVPRLLTDPVLFGDKLIYIAMAEVVMSFVVTWVFLMRKSLLSAITVRALYTFVLLSLLR